MKLNLAYSYDKIGNVSTIQDASSGIAQTQTFGYDALDRLTSASASGGTSGSYSKSYSYDSANGNLASKAGQNYNYNAQSIGCPDGAIDRAHMAVALGSTAYCYDKNGNMVRRTIGGGQPYNFAYDAENRLVTDSGAATASFVYDGDNQRVKGTVNSVTTTYVNDYFEWTGSTSTMKKYYYTNDGVRFAMREGESTSDLSKLKWMLNDHLGSVSKVVAADNSTSYTTGYKAWGEQRFALPSGAASPTSFGYTGQRQEAQLGLHYYKARWYDSSLGRFTSPDTIVPVASQGVLAWDRYAGMNNNPVRWNDPSGHKACSESGNSPNDCKDTLNITADEFGKKYGIGFQGKWPNENAIGGKNENHFHSVQTHLVPIHPWSGGCLALAGAVANARRSRRHG